MAKKSAEIPLGEEILNDASVYEPFFAKKCTLPQYSSRRWGKGIKQEPAKIDKSDTVEEGIIYSNAASQSSDSSNTDSDGLWIDLDPPANYKKRPSVNCFTTPIAQATVADNKLPTTAPPKLKVKHKASQTELKIKIIGTKKVKSKDRGSQTDIDYVVVAPPTPSLVVNHQTGLDKKGKTYWNRSKRRHSSNKEAEGERSSSHKSHKKKRRRPPSDRGSDSDMDPPTRGGEV